MSQCNSCSDSARFLDKFTVIRTMEGSFLVVKISRKILQLQENKKVVIFLLNLSSFLSPPPPPSRLKF